MEIITFILLMILTVGLIVVALTSSLPFWTIFAAACCIVLSIVAFSVDINTSTPIDKNIIQIDENNIVESYSYKTLSYNNDSFVLFVAWASLSMFFLVIINLVIKWSEVDG